MKSLRPSPFGRPGAHASLLLALAAGAVLVPETVADVPGSYGTVSISYTGDQGGFGGAGGLGALSNSDSYWRFGTQAYLDTSVVPKYMSFQIGSGPMNGQTVYGYCGDITKYLTTTGAVTYEVVPLRHLGYYSVNPTIYAPASSLTPTGIGVQKAKLLQSLANVRYLTSSVNVGANDTTKAAFQLAVWKIVSEAIVSDTKTGVLDDPANRWNFNQTPSGGYDGIWTGTYPDSGDADYYTLMTTAQGYLDAALDEYENYGTDDPVPATVTLSALTSPTTGSAFPNIYSQDLLIFGPVPEPQTYALAAGLGLVGFGLYRRMNRQG